MKPSQLLEQRQRYEHAAPGIRISQQDSDAESPVDAEKRNENAKVVFFAFSAIDVATMFIGLPSGVCDVSVVDDTDQAVRTIGESVPDLVVCPTEAWGAVGDRVGRALLQADLGRPVLVLLLPALGGDVKAPSRSGAWNEHDQLLQPVHDAIHLVSKARASAANTLSGADIRLDPVSHKVTRSGRTLRLSETTFRLLHTLMAAPDHVHSREELLRSLRGERISIAIRTIDVHIKRLRRELNAFGGPDVVRTVRGVGYAFSHETPHPVSRLSGHAS